MKVHQNRGWCLCGVWCLHLNVAVMQVVARQMLIDRLCSSSSGILMTSHCNDITLATY